MVVLCLLVHVIQVNFNIRSVLYVHCPVSSHLISSLSYTFFPISSLSYTFFPISSLSLSFLSQGFGVLLMEEAERIAKEEHGSVKIAVISGET